MIKSDSHCVVVTAHLLWLFGSVGTADAQQLKYARAEGCGNIAVYGWTEDRTEAIIVRADREQAGAAWGREHGERSGPIGRGCRGAGDVYERRSPELQEYYCNDVRLPEGERPANTLEAISGTLPDHARRAGVTKPKASRRRCTTPP